MLSLVLCFSNGEEWYRLRSAVQQMMMRPKAVTIYLPLVESVADDFIRRLKKVRVDKSKVIPNLRNEISKWNVKCKTYELVHEISNNVVCATSKASDQPAQARSLIGAFARRLSIL